MGVREPGPGGLETIGGGVDVVGVETVGAGFPRAGVRAPGMKGARVGMTGGAWVPALRVAGLERTDQRAVKSG